VSARREEGAEELVQVQVGRGGGGENGRGSDLQRRIGINFDA
jgi:hypothetical protein